MKDVKDVIIGKKPPRHIPKTRRSGVVIITIGIAILLLGYLDGDGLVWIAELAIIAVALLYVITGSWFLWSSKRW